MNFAEMYLIFKSSFNINSNTNLRFFLARSDSLENFFKILIISARLRANIILIVLQVILLNIFEMQKFLAQKSYPLKLF